VKELAPGLHRLSGFPPDAFNVYLVETAEGPVVVDTATRHARRRILRQLAGRRPAGILITHAHRDHAGAMHAVAEETGAPVWSSGPDADALEGKAPEPIPRPDSVLNRAFAGWWTERHPVARRLAEGERIGDFEVVAFPGHTPGMIGLWRESDRAVVCADTMRTVNLFTGIPQVGEMPALFTCDRPESRRSIRKLAALEARLVCPGHGRALRGDAAVEKVRDLAAGLPVEHPTP
jgi:glyoxylase-like metal-dependent hydrolase (beta-lactamase superfamily II)